MADIAEFKITQSDIDQTKVEGADDVLTGTAQQNKQIFDALPKRIAERYNRFLEDYVSVVLPNGDPILKYNQIEINTICAGLGCNESDILVDEPTT